MQKSSLLETLAKNKLKEHLEDHAWWLHFVTSLQDYGGQTKF